MEPIKTFIALFLLFAGSGQVISGGRRAPAGVAPPTIRCHTSQIWSSTTISLPSCKTAGDVVFIFSGTPNSYNARPSGWTDINTSTGTQWNGSLIEKVISSGDVTAGTVTWTAPFNPSVAFVVEMISNSFTIGTFASDHSTSTSPSTVNTPTNGPVSNGYLVLWFGSYRSAAAAPTINLGTTIESQSSGSFAAGVLSDQAITSSSSTLTPTFSYGTYNTVGYYNASILLHN